MSYFRGVVIEDIHSALQNILKALLRPLWVDPASSNVRTMISSGTVTTVTTVTNISQLGGFDNKQVTLNLLDRSNWYNSVRRCIT
jgi:hypothetical protein